MDCEMPIGKWLSPTKKNSYTPKTNMDTQNSHIWSRRYHLKTIMFGIYVRFRGVYHLKYRLNNLSPRPRLKRRADAPPSESTLSTRDVEFTPKGDK